MSNQVAIGVAVALVLIAVFFLSQGKKEVPVLDTVEWRPFKLESKTFLSKNTASYRFGLPRPTDSLGLPIGQHISIQAVVDGEKVQRSYTPTTLDDDKGHFQLVVKTYEKGKISSHLNRLKVGDTILVKGPKGKFVYTDDLAPHLLMIAGGTGITPMFQIIKSSLKNPNDKTKINLIYANVTEDDILLRKELEAFAAASNGRLTIHYVLNETPAGWTGGKGFVTRDMIEAHMHAEGVASGGKVLICGPPPMITAMKGHLAGIGYPAPRAVSKLEDQVFLF